MRLIANKTYLGVGPEFYLLTEKNDAKYFIQLATPAFSALLIYFDDV